MAMSKRPKWKILSTAGSASRAFRRGADQSLPSSCTRWALSSPAESCTRQSRSRCGLRPSVSVSMATEPVKVSPAGRSFLCSLMVALTGFVRQADWITARLRVPIRNGACVLGGNPTILFLVGLQQGGNVEFVPGKQGRHRLRAAVGRVEIVVDDLALTKVVANTRRSSVFAGLGLDPLRDRRVAGARLSSDHAQKPRWLTCHAPARASSTRCFTSRAIPVISFSPSSRCWRRAV